MKKLTSLIRLSIDVWRWKGHHRRRLGWPTQATFSCLLAAASHKSHLHNSSHVGTCNAASKKKRFFFFLHLGNMHFEMPLTWLLLFNFNHWSVLKEALFLSLFLSHTYSLTLSLGSSITKKKLVKMVRLDFYLTMRWQRWSFPISCLLQSWIFFLLIFTLSAISNQHTIFPPFLLPYDALPPCQIGHLNEI